MAAGNGGSSHSSKATRDRSWSEAVRETTISTRAVSRATTSSATRSAFPALATCRMASKTCERVCGSRLITCGPPGRIQAAARTSSTATAQTPHSAWVTIKSGRRPSSAGRSRVYRARFVRNRSRTRRSISALGASTGISVRVTFGSPRTNAGKAHSWVTPTSWSSSPRTQMISVALGSSETILIRSPTPRCGTLLRRAARAGAARRRPLPRATSHMPARRPAGTSPPPARSRISAPRRGS